MHQFIHKFCVTLSNLYWNVYHGFLVFLFYFIFCVFVCVWKKGYARSHCLFTLDSFETTHAKSNLCYE